MQDATHTFHQARTPDELKFSSLLSKLDDDTLIDIEEHIHFLVRVSVYAHHVVKEGNPIRDALDLFFDNPKTDVNALLDTVKSDPRCVDYLKKHPRALACLKNYDVVFLGKYNKKDLLNLRRIALQTKINIRGITEKEAVTMTRMIDSEICSLINFASVEATTTRKALFWGAIIATTFTLLFVNIKPLIA